jgi:hypothetical protein
MRQYWGKHCVPQKSLRLQADVLWWLFVAVFKNFVLADDEVFVVNQA